MCPRVMPIRLKQIHIFLPLQRTGIFTRLIFLAMGEVLSFGFNLVVLDPSDSRGNDTYCIVAIKDKKWGLYHIA